MADVLFSMHFTYYYMKTNILRSLKNADFYSSSRKAIILIPPPNFGGLTTGILGVFRGLKFELVAEIRQKVRFCKGLILYAGVL